MSDETTIGRLPAEEVDEIHTLDSPEQGYKAVLSKQDQIIDLLAALTAKLDGEGTLGGGYAAAVSDDLLKIKFRL